ncbi:NADPH-dependent oxidoreductase [Enterovirga rhinocerotis]|uniref:Nitroreductase n=1 Tax=Enterovirga rhinocerotis TaxID=1339210 RepID=A0A4R7BQ18_9HYPH|nr:NADPH-dependent oxidoreductase [Enterovirga rhinocerotis]TDR87233.1 nitroreductase [Enterovirga rhinocerotis]
MDADTTRQRIDAAWRERYGQGAAPEALPWNDTIALLMRHHSVRAYKPDPVPEGTLPLLVAAAQSAATSSNMQTWSVVAVSDPGTRAKLAAIAANQKHVEQCPLFLVFLADLSRAGRIGERIGQPMENLPYFETFLVASIDAALAAQNAVVAAESLGLSTLYIGALRNDPEGVATALGLPPGAMGVFGLCVGYADRDVPAGIRPRLPQAAVFHDERYDAGVDADLLASYDATFEGSRHGGGGSWTDRVRNRLGRISQLAGRDGLKPALRRMGFPLK